MKKRPTKISNLYGFLRRNHRYNRHLQERSLDRALASCGSNRERALWLLHGAVNSQSQPKLEKVSAFFREVCERRSALDSLADFRRYLFRRHPKSGCLCDALSQEKGWGPKTAALFVRNLVMIGKNQELRSQFWTDLEKIADEPIFVPVDSVILEVFRLLQANHQAQLGTDRRLNTFQAINCYLKFTMNYDNRQMLIWDDLWFWGFITQRSTAGTKTRTHGWNEDKYWSVFSTRKSPGAIRRAQELSSEFLILLGIRAL